MYNTKNSVNGKVTPLADTVVVAIGEWTITGEGE